MIVKGTRQLGSFKKGLNIFIPKKNVIAATNIMRDLLSASGKTAYDAAAIDNWFSVSSADYAAVASGLSNVSKYAMTDAQTAENGVLWSNGYAQAFPSTIGTIPSNTYLIGFISRTNNGGTSTPLISMTFRGTYTAIANSPNAATGGSRGYFLRKASAATASTSYIGIVNNGSDALNGTTVFNLPAAQGGAYDGSSPYSTWVTWNGSGVTFNIFQMLGTSIKQW